YRLCLILLYFTEVHRSPLPSTPLPYPTLFRSGCEGVRAPSDFDTIPPHGDRQQLARLPPASAAAAAPACTPSAGTAARRAALARSEEHTSELQSRVDLVCRLLLEKKN